MSEPSTGPGAPCLSGCGSEATAYPADWVREDKFWPSVRRVNDTYGDRNLFCACPPTDAYEADEEDELEAALDTA
ncbi:MAG: hypothetical protein BRD42_05550 [Bacteroidetes bacterium QS_3_64_15]|nr:MAG: hypothetical protein BRD42_05550 [Bacteroidetes bacterium QS_3_64_15]